MSLDLNEGAYDDMSEDTPRTPITLYTCRRKSGDSPFARLKHEQSCLAQHSSKSWEHYTPIEYVQAAREVLGGIDLDPASCWLAQRDIQATKWYGLGQMSDSHDGLAQPWSGRVLLNPPGGNTALVRPELASISRSYPVVWWGKLCAHYLAADVPSAIYVGFSLEQLITTQRDDMPAMLDFPCCYPRKRIQFDYPLDTRDGVPLSTTERTAGTQPSHGNVIVYLPDRNDSNSIYRFRQVFERFGKVVVP